MRALGLYLLLLLSSCASTPQSRHIQAEGLGDLPLAVELDDTPFYPQAEYQCGPAALATSLAAHGVITSTEILSDQVYLPDRKGSLQIEMVATARRYDMLPYILKPELLDLFTEVAAGNPVIVMQNLGMDWYPQWHYAVVIGYDAENRDVILRSGQTKRWVTPFEVFERTWKRADYWALVVVPVGQVPQTAETIRYLKTAYDFEQIGNSDLAFEAYQAASERWPSDPVTWMTLGNVAFSNDNWTAAIRAFSTATRLDSASTDAWNNLGYALHAYGCGEQALRALQCGLAINPEDDNLRGSLQELAAGAHDTQAEGCPSVSCY